MDVDDGGRWNIVDNISKRNSWSHFTLKYLENLDVYFAQLGHHQKNTGSIPWWCLNFAKYIYRYSFKCFIVKRDQLFLFEAHNKKFSSKNHHQSPSSLGYIWAIDISFFFIILHSIHKLHSTKHAKFYLKPPFFLYYCFWLS